MVVNIIGGTIGAVAVGDGAVSMGSVDRSGTGETSLRNTPRYQDEEIRQTCEDLEQAYLHRDRLRLDGADTQLIQQQIDALHYKLREGGRLVAGDTFEDGRYLLLDRVGDGGFAIVWKVADRRANDLAAIKVLHPNFALDHERRNRFFRGARAMAQLEHKAVVKIRKQHGKDRGFLYFVMDLIEGPTLHRAVIDGTMKQERALSIIVAMSNALAHAHGRGITHRDVKPQNILINASGEPFLTDFDLVRIEGSESDTKAGGMGTHIYTAPELYTHPKDANPGTDTYSLGMTAIFSLHGKDLPATMLGGHIDKLIDDLSCNDATKTVLQKAVVWGDPKQRYPNASEFRAALQQANPQIFGHHNAATNAQIAIQILEDDIPVEIDWGPLHNLTAKEKASDAATQSTEKSIAEPHGDEGANSGVSQSEQAKEILNRVDAYYAARDLAKAITLVRHGVAMCPSSRALRSKLCDLLIEAGDHDGGIREMVLFAQQLSVEGDVPAAAKVLDEVLLIDPAQPDATQMLRALGYEVPDFSTLHVESNSDDDAKRVTAILQRAEAFYAVHDLASMIPVLREGLAAFPASRELRSKLCDVLIEAGDHEGGIREMLIFAQRLSIEGDVPAAAKVLDEVLLVDPTQHDAIVMLRALGYDVATPVPPDVHPQQSASPYGGTLDEDVLEQIDFFANQGLLEDARMLLDDQLLRLPNHPMLLYKRAELEQLARSEGNDKRPSEHPPDENAEDIARMIDEIGDPLLEQSASTVQPEYPQWKVDTVFQQFKAGVTAQISESDAATHYDLGVAYREMGRYGDAINEFEVAARDPSRECVCRSVVGIIHLQFGRVDAAIASFQLGLKAPKRTREQELALAYEIADAYETRKNIQQALYYFKHVTQIDPKYRDPRGGVQDRIRRLDPNSKMVEESHQKLNSDDFDAEFDELFESGKLP